MREFARIWKKERSKLVTSCDVVTYKRLEDFQWNIYFFIATTWKFVLYFIKNILYHCYGKQAYITFDGIGLHVGEVLVVHIYSYC